MAEIEKNKFLELIDQYEGIIHKVVGLYVTHNEEKKDLVQEILLQAWRSSKQFRADSKFSTWLYRVALNTALNFKKKRSKKIVNNSAFGQEIKNLKENIIRMETLEF